MKIAFVYQPQDSADMPPRGSIKIWNYEVARRLARDHDVIVYTRGGRFNKQVEYAEGIQYRRLPVGPDLLSLQLLEQLSRFRHSKRPLFASSWFYLGYALQIAYDLRKQQYDIVHLYNYSQFIPIIRAFNPELKIVLRMSCEWLTQLDRRMIERRLNDVDLVIGCSEYITADIRQTYPSYADRCLTVHNGRDVHHFMPQNGQVKTRQNDLKKLLFIGRISPEKGVHVLIEAFQQVVAHYSRVKLEILGSQAQLPLALLISLSDQDKVQSLASFYNGDSPYHYFSQLQEWVQHHNLADQVSFVEPVPHLQLIKYYQAADIFIFPSVWDEPSGNPPIEAMAVGVPVISTRTGGTPEYVADGETGLLVEPGDVNALAEAILSLLKNEPQRRRMGEAARRRAVELFSYERLIEQLLDHYETICNGNKRSINSSLVSRRG